MVKHTQFVGNLPTNCLNVFVHFGGLALKDRCEQLRVFSKSSVANKVCWFRVIQMLREIDY